MAILDSTYDERKFASTIHPGGLASNLRRSVGIRDAELLRRWSRATEFSGWLEQDALTALSPEQAVRLYRASGGRESEAFSANSTEEVRDSLDFLLYDTIKLEGRFDECVSPNGAYKLAGAGKEFISWLLCLRNPALFCVWNSNAERMLRRAGAYPSAMKRGPEGIRYLDLLEALGRLGSQAGLPNFIAVDETAWLSTRPNQRNPKPMQVENHDQQDGLA